MVVLSNQLIKQLTVQKPLPKPTDMTKIIPVIDLSNPDASHHIVKACEDFGFFKIINHRIPADSISTLESESVSFFSHPLPEKERIGSPYPRGFGYGNKRIGINGDIGWLEYLLMTTKSHIEIGHNSEPFRRAVHGYLSAVQLMAGEVLELMADGLGIEQRDVFSRLIMDEQSDSLFRVNHYPPRPDIGSLKDRNLVGFGEHTDPQIVSVLRSNNTPGLEISLRDGNWVSVPSNHSSFFFNVGDSLQVMTNGRFGSVRHRVVVANSCKSRLSMIYFGGPPMNERIAPLPELMGVDQKSLYKEFTWHEYREKSHKCRLADNRLLPFENIVADS